MNYHGLQMYHNIFGKHRLNGIGSVAKINGMTFDLRVTLTTRSCMDVVKVTENIAMLYITPN